MEIDQILGGVSPLKARSGKHARAATSTASKRGGYSKSTSSKNRGGYNRQTRFQADKWTPPPSGGDIGPVASPSAPAATAPYSGGTTNYTFGGDTDNSTNTDNSNYQVDESVNTQKSEITNPQKTEVETTPIDTGETPEKPKKGGFYEACHNADGSRKKVGSTGIDSNGKEWGCVWDRNWKPKSGGGSKSKGTQVAEVKTNSQITNNVTQTIDRKRLFDKPQ